MKKLNFIVAQAKNFNDPLTGCSGEENETFVNCTFQGLKGSDKSNERLSKDVLNKRCPLGASFPYLQEYELVCNSANSQEIFQWGLNSELSACRFRSICWRVFLKVLPPTTSKWLHILRSKREEYESTRHKLAVNPDLVDETLDPCVNNPLSQNEESPWNKYFEDSELKQLIRLDVQRTFPEIEFFQLPRIQEMMVSILFCYARKYPNISYVQGMHEILAPLTFVLNLDHLSHTHIMEQNVTPTLLQELMDQAYLEHDSFALFEVVMERLHHWYEDTEFKSNWSPKIQLIQSQPFSRPQDIGPTTKIVQRLTRIHDFLVKKWEPEIFAHLTRLEIPPQVYGIRWARLMLGREFTLTDLLTVWDAIFANQDENFVLIEYLMVAMLSYIKEDLIDSDYITSLNMLMRYPSGTDVESIIKLALYFQSPKSRIRPRLLSSSQPVQTIGGQQNIHREPQTPLKTQSHLTRSSSLPRSSFAGASQLKHRSTSVDQRPRSSGEARNSKASPTVDSTGSLGGNMIERPMDELSIVRRSAPIPALKGDEATIRPIAPLSSSTESEDNLSYVQRNIKAGRCRRPSAEDLVSICLGCALRLSNYQATLSTRLAQLNIESDFTVRTSMEGITEVIDILRQVRPKPRKISPSDSKTGSTHCPREEISSNDELIRHPLMDADDIS